ncbi:hypothetical protein K469DRAFT_532975, partial [Zopfia rhizophila CBS 207.26]
QEAYFGFIKDLEDALVVCKACNAGFLPTVRKRLSQKEKDNIRSGSVFVWGEDIGVSVWRDRKLWTSSLKREEASTSYEVEAK